jgi:hypothetical protein
VKKDARLLRRIENMPVSTPLLDKIKKLVPKISIGIGTLVTGLAKAFNSSKAIIKDIIEHIPVLSNVPPELVGAWLVGTLVGGWLLGKALVKPLIWHFEVIRGKLPMREAKKKAKLRAEISKERETKQWEFNEKRDAFEAYYARIAENLHAQAQAQHQKILEGFKADYARMLAEHGYVSPN